MNTECMPDTTTGIEPDPTAQLFAPDTLIKYDFYHSIRQPEPEQQLMHGVLQQAICDLRDSNDQVRTDSYRWFRASDESEWLYSFENVCLELGISASKVRKGIEALGIELPEEPDASPREDSGHVFITTTHCEACLKKYHREYSRNRRPFKLEKGRGLTKLRWETWKRRYK